MHTPRSPLNYVGGKSRLADTIIHRIPAHHCYCEPFAGAAWVFFTKPRSKVEILNDMDGDLVTFWRVIQRHKDEFIRSFQYAIASRRLWTSMGKCQGQCLTDIERACRYYYLQRLCFAGRPVARTFGAGPHHRHQISAEQISARIDEAHCRIASALVENLDACECIRRYDRPDTFFYIDPPYWGFEKYYAAKFGKADFTRLVTTCAAMKGKFILSINDTPEIQSLFKAFPQALVHLRYSAGNEHQAPGSRAILRSELLVSNV